MDNRSTKSMDIVGALIESPRVRTAGPNAAAVVARRALAVAQRAQLPWLLALLPVGSLVAAGLLVLVLSRLVPVSPPPPDVPIADFAEPAATSLNDNDDWTITFAPMYTR